MEKKILFVDLFSSYGFGTTLVRKIAASFEAAGYIPVILDVESPDAAQTLRQCIRNKKEFLFSFSVGWGITEASKVGGKYIHQWLEIPHYASFVDHPLYKQEFIDFRLIDTLYGFTDETQVEFCKAFYYKKGNYSVFPHFSLIEVDEPISEDEFAKRGKQVFFSGGATIMERAWSANISSPLQSKAVCSLKQSGVDIEGLIERFICKEDYPPPGYHPGRSAPITPHPLGDERSTDRKCIHRDRCRPKSHKAKARLGSVEWHQARHRGERLGSV